MYKVINKIIMEQTEKGANTKLVYPVLYCSSAEEYFIPLLGDGFSIKVESEEDTVKSFTKTESDSSKNRYTELYTRNGEPLYTVLHDNGFDSPENYFITIHHGSSPTVVNLVPNIVSDNHGKRVTYATVIDLVTGETGKVSVVRSI